MSEPTPPADQPQPPLPEPSLPQAPLSDAVAAPTESVPAVDPAAAPAADAYAPPPAYPAADPYAPPPAYPAYPAADPYAAPAYPPAYPAYPPAAAAPAPATTSSNAVIALILAIVSWAVCPIIPAIVALVLAHSAAKEIAASGGRIQGGGLVTAARIVSWINIGLWAAVIVVGAFFLILAAVAGGLNTSN